MSNINYLLAPLTIISGVISFVLAALVLRGLNHRAERMSFVFFAVSMGLWSVLVGAFLLTSSQTIAIWSVKLYYIAAILLSYALLLFSMAYTSRWRHTRRQAWKFTIKHWLLLVPIFAVAVTVVIQNGLIESIHMQSNRFVVLQPGYYWLYVLVFTIYGCAALYHLVIVANWRVARRPRSQLIGWVVCACLLFASIFNLFLPLTGIYSWVAVGPIFVLPVVIVFSYAIIRHGLFDVKLAVIRSVAYFLLLVTMVGLYFGIVFILSGLFHSSSVNSFGLMINAGIAIVLALFFQPMKSFFDHLTSHIFYRDNYSTDDFFAHINRELSATTDLRSLLQRAATEIGRTVKAEQSFFFIRYGDHRFIMAGSKNHHRVLLSDIAQLDTFVEEYGYKTIFTDMLIGVDTIETLLSKHQIAIVLPLRLNDGSTGYFFLGTPRSRNYTRRDIRLLETISDELVIAIQNALSIQDVEEINQTLQQRIEDATKELRRTNAQLQRLDAAKDEFISMASHQLRTPLTSVKGYISMVLEGDAGKITDMQHKLLSEAFVSSERMVHLISDFLNVSRLQTGKFMLEQHAVDLAKITAQEVDGLQSIAKSHDLKLKFKSSARIPVLYLDEGKIRQVIMNFIDNAIYYSREFTTITITVSVDAGNVLLQVQDTGIGVPESEQLHLFTKFFRATNARKQRPDGTGVGLFLAKKVIAAHGGSVVFHSTEGDGSTFGFRLPIKKLQSAPAHQADNL